ncbi:transcription factor YY2 [Podospora fimiseda]|uniref:Transcription factor YY2 n=1 Tax=Podospora fimiseda TaxID=252190 RepID=A0AAN7C0G2_9PEZI|nr:transcription factor YY2 [Podospora fimiseda]
MAVTTISTQYATAPPQSMHYGYMPPPSPPMDDSASRCSLPSISNLLGLADQGSPTSETSPQNRAEQQQQCMDFGGMDTWQSVLTTPSASTCKSPTTRPGSSHFGNPSLLRTALPPSPPMTSDQSFDGYSSPSTRSVSQISNNGQTSQYFFETTPPLAPLAPLAQIDANAPASAPRVTIQPSTFQPQFAGPAFLGQPAMPTYFPPSMQAPAPPAMSSLFFQRPLPQTFPPPMSLTLAPVGGGNPWQHHHYIATSSTQSYPQSQDRYICQTCNKAFSRPSSLRIHSHSHTGEKPFKCPVAGCGKAFSVRSNMKRHERGCHNYDSRTSSNNNTNNDKAARS